MTEYIEENLFLKEYASSHNIYDLSSEDIIKLMMRPYIISDICEAFNITEEEFNNICKRMGITNITLENIVRNIETVLQYIDDKGKYVSNKIRKKVVDRLAHTICIGIPRKNFYINKILNMDFSRGNVLKDLAEKRVDQEYRLNNLKSILIDIDNFVASLLEQEKTKLLKYNNKKLYKELCDEKENGKNFSKEDLSYDILYELSIIENISDSFVSDIFNMSVSELRYLRKKNGLSNKFATNMKDHPEAIMYYMEEKGERIEGASNYDYDKSLNIIYENFYENKESINEEKQSISEKIIVNLDGEDICYNVIFSDEKYSPNKSNKKRKNIGSRRHQKEESETKRKHGKIGEQIALEAEKKRLMRLGLKKYISEIKLVAQIDEETTFDGLGYDLISYNEVGEQICIEIKTSFGTKDKPFFISKKEIEIIQGIREEFACKQCLIYYVLVDGTDVKIKTIHPIDLNTLELEPVLYQVK